MSEVIFHPTTEPLVGPLIFRQDIDGFMGTADRERITSFLRHDGSFDGDVHHAGGRNVTLTLEEPRGQPYDSVQVSGGAYIPMGITSNADTRHGVAMLDHDKPTEIYPPVQGDQQFTHSYHIIEDGEFAERKDHSPMGSYAQALAERKLDMTARAARIVSGHLLVPYVLGKKEFDNLPDGQGGKATALLFSVPFRGQRADETQVTPLINAINQHPDKRDAVLDHYLPPVLQTVYMTGRIAADIHQAGIVHNQLTLGNVLAIEGKNGPAIYVADWETAADIDPGKDKLAQMFDLITAFGSFSGTVEVLREDGKLPEDQGVSIMKEAFMVLLAGYHDISLDDGRRSWVARSELWERAFHAVYLAQELTAENYAPVVELADELEQANLA